MSWNWGVSGHSLRGHIPFHNGTYSESHRWLHSNSIEISCNKATYGQICPNSVTRPYSMTSYDDSLDINECSPVFHMTTPCLTTESVLHGTTSNHTTQISFQLHWPQIWVDLIKWAKWGAESSCYVHWSSYYASFYHHHPVYLYPQWGWDVPSCRWDALKRSLIESGTQLTSARDYTSRGPPVARLPVNRYCYCISRTWRSQSKETRMTQSETKKQQVGS